LRTPTAERHLRWQLGISLASLMVCSGCEPGCAARGTLLVPGGSIDARCTARLVSRPGNSTAGANCHAENRKPTGDAADWVIHPGQKFECATIPGLPGEELAVQVSCPGYPEQLSRDFAWSLHGLRCQDVDVGSISITVAPTN